MVDGVKSGSEVEEDQHVEVNLCNVCESLYYTAEHMFVKVI